MFDEFFRNRLAQLRIQKGISARYMSLSMGQGPAYINNIENGRNKPSMDGFYYICDYFHITPKEFFDEENHNPERLQELMSEAKGLTGHQLAHIIAVIKDIKHKD